jgi:hypothetical protein
MRIKVKEKPAAFILCPEDENKTFLRNVSYQTTHFTTQNILILILTTVITPQRAVLYFIIHSLYLRMRLKDSLSMQRVLNKATNK